MKNIGLLVLAAIGLAIIPKAEAQFYFRPSAGGYVSMDGGDAAFTLGGNGGYSFNQYFSAGLGYSHIFGSGSTSDGDIIKGEGILSYPLEFITPFMSAGMGVLHSSIPGDDPWDPMGLVGAGLSLSFGSLGVTAGVSYAIVDNSSDFIEPYVGIGF